MSGLRDAALRLAARRLARAVSGLRRLAATQARRAQERHRRSFLDAAVRYGLPAAVLVCEVPPETARARLAARHDDASDADWAVYLRAAREWEPPGEEVRRVLSALPTEGSPDRGLSRSLEILREMGLH